MSRPFVEVEKLRFSYGQAEVLHEISFTLKSGEIVGLVGPNGAGKSTTIKIIAGILSASGGRVSIGGLSLPEKAIDAKALLGYVPEAGGLFDCLNGQEFLELCGHLHGVQEQTLQAGVSNLLEMFSLSKDRFRRLEGYSKGMRQKVLIAAALLHNPQLILMDEPLSGLDVNAGILVKNLLSALAAQGKIILYSSHILEVVEKICTRVLIIHRGYLVADGSVESLKARTRRATLEDVFLQLTNQEIHSAEPFHDALGQL